MGFLSKFVSKKSDMPQESRLSAPIRLVMRLLLTIGLLWLLNTFLDQYFYVNGGLPAFIILGSLITLMNVIIRPVLQLVLLPFRFFFHLLTLVMLNALFLWLTLRIAAELDPDVVTFAVNGGIAGWLLIALLLGFAHWVMKETIR